VRVDPTQWALAVLGIALMAALEVKP